MLVATAGASSAIDLATAIRRAIEADPRMPGTQLEVEAARGGVLQAGKRPNPELQVEIEDFFGTGDYRGFDSATLTVSLQQKFERGGKREARLAAAAGKESVAMAEIAVAMREIIAQTKIDYIAVLGAAEKIEVLRRALKRFEDLVPLLKRRVEAGASPQADVGRGDLAAGKVRVLLEKARIELQSAKRQLVSNWQGRLDEAATVAGRLRHNGHPLTPLQVLLSAMEEHPAIRAWTAVYAQREGELRVQRATASPDITLGLGVSRVYESNDTTMRFSGSMPLPIHDRNEGGIIEAERKLEKVEFERQAALRTIRRKLIDAHAELEANCFEAKRLQEGVIPVARRTTDDVQNSFDQGRLGVKDLLDSNRDIYEVEVANVEAELRCHAAAAKVETLAAHKPFQLGWNAVTRKQ
jgi:cobalt-zinc-cadmium efflux system outer membrane protein